MSNSLTKFNKNPFFALRRDEFLTPFDKIFDEFFAATVPTFGQDFGVDFFEKGSYPRVNLIDYRDKVLIEAEVPGLDKNDVSVEIQENVLTIGGGKVKKVQPETEEGTYLRRELKRSSFRRSFTLGDNLDKSSVDAKFENGVLTVTLKKVKPSQPEIKRVEIK